MIWTISDLHLSTVQPKPMDIFGSHWKNHPQRIATAWKSRVASTDWVLIGGDISWAMKLSQAKPDLAWLEALPGQKVLIKGNHDYWWDRVGPLRSHLPPSLHALEGDAIDIGPAIVCGTRGWITPETPGFNVDTDQRIFNRELGRLERALTAAEQIATDDRPIIVMIHYPPFLNRQPTEFSRRIAATSAAACIYGHLHRPNDWASAAQGLIDGVYYQLTSCDYLGFGPVGVRGL